VWAQPRPIRGLRIAVARLFARLLKLLAINKYGRRTIQILRDFPPTRSCLRFLLGFNRTFSSLNEAEVVIRRYFEEGHDNQFHNLAHAGFSEITRESDYPVLYLLSPLASQLRSVFDLGGSIGNLFYSYDRELHFSSDLRWIVNDLPHKKEPALEYAKSKGERRIVFSDKFSDASGVDLLIVSGAAHYFEENVPAMLSRLTQLPKIVAVNRTPFSIQHDIVTIQDGGRFALACKLHDMKRFVDGMVAIGYELVAQWQVHERTVQVPLYPELTDTYQGFFFRLANFSQIQFTRD